MKISNKFIIFSIIGGLFIWILDAVIDFLIFYEGTFWGVLISDLSPIELYMRLVWILTFIFFSFLVAKISTKQKNIQKELDMVEKEKKNVLDALSEHVLLHDLHMRVLSVNLAACESVGLKSEEILGRHCYEIWHDSDKPCKGCPVVRARDTGIPQEAEMITPDGKYWLVKGYPIKDKNGHIVNMAEITIDVTENKRAREKLAEIRDNLEDLVKERTRELTAANENLQLEITEHKDAEDMLRRQAKIIDQIHDSVISTDLDGYVTTWNKGAERIFGYTEKEAIGKHISFVYPKKEHRFLEQKVIAPLKQKGIHAIEVRMQRKTGQEFYADLSLSLLRNSVGEVIGMIGYSNDITERKKAEEKLDRFFKLSLDMLYIAGFNGYFKRINPAFKKTLGYSAKKLLETPFLDLIHPEDKDATIAELEKLATGAPTIHFENRYKCKDGSYKWFAWTSFPVVHEKIMYSVARDITEQKRMEEELQKIEKLEAIGVLAGGIAHDFNNLLTGVIGNLSLAELSVKKEDNLYETITAAKIAAKQAEQLTQQLLTFSKGGTPIKEPTSISELIKETASFCLRGSKVKCDCSMPNDLWPVEIDKGQMSQVIHNLIINANHAMPEGGTINISIENTTLGKNTGLPLKEGKYIKISIKDQGIGIPKEYLRKIFDPYFTTKQEGSGLGLATCHSIVKNHGGHIMVESELGNGSSFYIYLPAEEKERFMIEHVEEIIYSGEGRILFMDDEQNVINTARRILTRLGYKVETAKDGIEAVELYRKAKEEGTPFDVVIFDLTVPGGMGGKEAIQKLRQIDSKVKAIVSSGYSRDPIMSKYMSYGFHGVISKPYEVKELSKVLYEVIKMKK